MAIYLLKGVNSMKLRFAIAFVVCFSMITGIAIADQDALTTKIKSMSGLIAYYPLESDYKDVGPKKLHGAEVGDAKAFGWTDGVNGGKALTIDSDQFNGSFLDIPAPIGSPFDTATASCVTWVKLYPKNGWQAICERSNLWYLETENKPAEWKDNAVVWRIYDPVAVGGGGAGQMRDNANIAIKDNEWYQLGWTYDGLTMVGYVNGKKVISKDYPDKLGPVAGTPNPPPAGKGANYNLSLGTWQQRDDWFKGAIDDFAYFSSVLTENEMMSLYETMMSASSSVTSKDKSATLWGEIKTK
ncbi:TPA: LamG domain-containing protein [bacterium]|nr:LamG domain-containing protein [bacterium]